MRRLHLLGAPQVEQDGAALRLERRKALALLAYLAVTRHPHTRESLATLFWEYDERARAYAYLRNTLWTINKILGDDWAIIEGETVAFNPNSGIEVDVTIFISCVDSAATLINRRARIETLSCAVELYRADFMAGFTLPDAEEFATWQTYTAEGLRQQFCGVLETLADDYAALGENETALTYARRRVSLDSLNEAAHRDLMRLLADAGQHAAALRHYRDLTQLLAQEIGAKPEAETVALVETIQQRRHQPAVMAVAVSAPPPAAVESPFPRPDSRLPTPTTPLIGRAEELEELARRLDDPTCRLLTIVGSGGMGKTRLAIQAATQSRYPDGAYFISLAPLCAPDAILSTIAAALPFVPETRDTPQRRLVDALREKQLLLVLDNFEHLLDGAELLSPLLEQIPGVKMLVTSRERLNLREEYLYEMRGLSYPPALQNGHSTESYDAVQLFVSSALRVRPEFKLTPENSAAVALICRMVEGLPLGIELAASWVQMLSCHEIAQEIQRGLDFLTTPARNVPERHRSLRAVFESSWNRLPPFEQTSLAQLSVFRGGFRLEAATVVANASLHMLLALVNKSLIYRSINGRFEIHELLRQYAEEKLTDRAATLERHSAYYAGFLIKHDDILKGAEQGRALVAIGEDIDNIRMALQNIIKSRDHATLLKMLTPLFNFHVVRAYFNEFIDLLETAQLDPDDPDDQLLHGCLLAYVALGRAPSYHQSQLDRMVAQAYDLLKRFPDRIETALPLVIVGSMKRRPGRVDVEAEPIQREGLALFRKHGDQWGEAYALFSIGATLHMQIRYAEAREIFHTSLAMFRQTGQPWGQTLVMDMLSENMFTLGNYDAARDYLEQMVPLLEKIGQMNRIGNIHALLSWYEQHPDQVIKADLLVSALDEFGTLGDRRAAAWTRYNLAWIKQYNENFDEAVSLYNECLREFLELGEDEGIIWTHIFLADIAVERREFDKVQVHAQHVRDTLKELIFPWGVSGLDYVLGNAALEQGDLASAETHYKDAVRVAYQAESIMQTLRHLSGLIELWWKQEMPEKALEMALFVRDHPTTWDDTRRRIKKFLTMVEKLVPPEMIADAQTAAKQATLETMVAKVLDS